MNYFPYKRKSSEDKSKQIQSIEDQQTWITGVQEERGLQLIGSFSDVKTATKPGREGFNKMMEAISKSPEPVGIICWKLDRLARNPVDEGVLKYALMQGKIKHIITHEKEYHEGENQILMGVEFGAATQYSIDLGISVTRGLNTKVEKGWRPTMAPIGYKNDVYGLKGQKKIYKDEVSWSNVRKIWDFALTGNYSGPKLLKKAEEMGLKNRKGGKIPLSNFYKILSNPFYAGMISWNGELKQGAHDPMVSLQEFEDVQTILKLGNQKRDRVHENTYAGLIKCGECGGMITSEPPKIKTNKGNGKVHIYHYLRCSKRKLGPKCQQKYLEKDKLEDQIIEKLAEIEIPLQIQTWIFEQLREKNKEETKGFSRERTMLQARFNENETFIDTLTNKLVEGVIENETYKLKRTEFEKQRMRLKEQMEDYDSKKDRWLEKTETYFQFAIEAPKAYKKATTQRKREILTSLGSDLSMTNKRLLIQAILPFTSIKSSVAKTKLIFDMFEPEGTSTEKRKEALTVGLSLFWSG